MVERGESSTGRRGCDLGVDGEPLRMLYITASKERDEEAYLELHAPRQTGPTAREQGKRRQRARPSGRQAFLGRTVAIKDVDVIRPAVLDDDLLRFIREGVVSFPASEKGC